ncbi:MAG TPA: PAS domain S-box protein [Bacteroidales bacterium]|nr:PAS domain S-box protein [Bacteroidales bacterium]
MSYVNKSRDELIAELQELQGKYNYLRDSFEAYKANCEIDDAGGVINPEQRQKHFESSLRQTEALFDKVFHCSPAPMAITQKPSGEYFAVNDSFLRLFELSREEVIGRKSYELGLIDVNARERVLQSLEEKKGILNVEIMAQTKMGRSLWLLASLENAEIMNRQFTLATMLDITERRQAELLLEEKAKEIEVQNEEYLQLNEELNQINQELHLTKDKIEESLQTYSMLFESIPDAVLISEVTSDGKSSRFIVVNDIACQRLGYSREELLTMTPFDINSEKSRSVIYRLMSEMYEKKHAIIEVEHVTKQGKIIPVEVSINLSVFRNRTILHAIARDITERKQSERLLVESENKFRKIYEEGPYGMVLVNEEFRFMMANNMFCQILEYSEEELKRLTFKQITYKEDAETDISSVQKLVSGELKVYRTEKRYVTKSGRIIWGMLTATAQFSDDGQFQYNLGIITDITDRKQSEFLLQEKANEIEAQNEEYLQINEELNQINEELVLAKERIEESEETYRVLFESINDAVFVSEIVDGKIGPLMKVNDIACQRLEYERQELLNTSPLKYSSEKMKNELPPIIQRLFETNHAIFESEHVTKSGKIIPVEISTRIARLKNKRVLHSIVRDITERTRNLQAIKQSEDKFRKAFLTNPDAITINRLSDGMYISVNKGFTKIFGYTEEEAVGKTSQEINIWHNYEDRKTFVQELRTNGMIENFETRFNNRDGQVIDGLVFTSVIDLEGEPHILTVTRDVTEQKRSELLIREKTEMIETQNQEYLQLNEELIQANKNLLEAKERAEQSDRLKTAFLQNMSHEIRTPMNAIMGFSELLVDQYNNKAKLEQYSQIINQRSADLLNIINEILDVAKIESGQLPVNPEECNISALFSEIELFFEEYKKRQNKQHLAFKIQVDREAANISVRLDKVKLKQVMINLIGNAFKFTDEGEITVGCRLSEDHHLLFYVSDTGIGIPADKQEFIFERFAQLEAVPGRLYGGTGLGLSIVKGLIGLLGGKIWIESVPDKGSTFYFTFPYEVDRVPSLPSIAGKERDRFNFRGKTILLVEDDEYNADYLKEALDGTHINIIHSVYGNEAVQIAKTQHPDLVLMDIRLPDMDGYAASRIIQRSHPDIKIIAQTAYAAVEDRDRAISAGCIDYISKPIKKEALLEMIDRYL